MIGYVNKATIYGLILNNITVNGYARVGIFGYVQGTDGSNKANIYGIRVKNETITGEEFMAILNKK